MSRTTLTIDGHDYLLSEAVDVTDLKAVLVSAVSTRPSFVDVATVDHGVVSVLVSSSTRVRFRSTAVAELDSDEWSDLVIAIDLEDERR